MVLVSWFVEKETEQVNSYFHLDISLNSVNSLSLALDLAVKTVYFVFELNLSFAFQLGNKN